MAQYQRDRIASEKAVKQARTLINENNAVIFDTETTGLGEDDQVIQIGIVDLNGNTLLSTLIRARHGVKIHAKAHEAHGITQAHLTNAPTFPIIYPQIVKALAGRTVVAYNLSFDARLLQQTIRAHGLDPIRFDNSWCAMKAYAEYHGAWNSRYRSYRWHKLEHALTCLGLSFGDVDGDAHDATADAKATLLLIKAMAKAG